MATEREGNDGRERREPASEGGERKGKDVMHGRDFAGANIFATEREQTEDRERVVREAPLDDADEMVTDAEVEARELRRSERDED